jgi:hypothetical protein
MLANTRIVKVKKNNNGDITDVLLENGNIVPLNHAILMVKKGIIDDVAVRKGEDGGEFLIPDPDASSYDNLNNYPAFY